MSDKVYRTISGAVARVNDTLTRVFGRDGNVCLLLKRGEYTSEFEKVRELTRGFMAEYGDRALREDIFLDVADSDEDLHDDWAVATHVAYGIPDCNNEVYVYAMDPEQKDASHPDAASPTYKAFLRRIENERYKVD